MNYTLHCISWYLYLLMTTWLPLFFVNEVNYVGFKCQINFASLELTKLGFYVFFIYIAGFSLLKFCVGFLNLRSWERMMYRFSFLQLEQGRPCQSRDKAGSKLAASAGNGHQFPVQFYSFPAILGLHLHQECLTGAFLLGMFYISVCPSVSWECPKFCWAS